MNRAEMLFLEKTPRLLDEIVDNLVVIGRQLKVANLIAIESSDVSEDVKESLRNQVGRP